MEEVMHHQLTSDEIVMLVSLWIVLAYLTVGIGNALVRFGIWCVDSVLDLVDEIQVRISNRR